MITLILGVKPGDIKKTGFYREFQMCQPQKEVDCQHPEKLKGKPGECSPEQIKECHGQTEEHPCPQE
jgi:hypothetical protein